MPIHPYTVSVSQELERLRAAQAMNSHLVLSPEERRQAQRHFDDRQSLPSSVHTLLFPQVYEEDHVIRRIRAAAGTPARTSWLLDPSSILPQEEDSASSSSVKSPILHAPLRSLVDISASHLINHLQNTAPWIEMLGPHIQERILLLRASHPDPPSPLTKEIFSTFQDTHYAHLLLHRSSLPGSYLAYLLHVEEDDLPPPAGNDPTDHNVPESWDMEETEGDEDMGASKSDPSPTASAPIRTLDLSEALLPQSTTRLCTILTSSSALASSLTALSLASSVRFDYSRNALRLLSIHLPALITLDIRDCGGGVRSILYALPWNHRWLRMARIFLTDQDSPVTIDVLDQRIRHIRFRPISLYDQATRADVLPFLLPQE